MAYNKETGMWEGYIYKIWNEKNNKLYIGQTIRTVKDRWRGHKSASKNIRNRTDLYFDMRFYGIDYYHIEELEKVTEKTRESLIITLNQLEKEYIDKFHTRYLDSNGGGYNIESGGRNEFEYKMNTSTPVCKYDLSLNFLQKYNSIKEAAADNNISDFGTIGEVCSQKNKRCCTAGGFVWAYEGKSPVAPRYIQKNEKQFEKVQEYLDSLPNVDYKERIRLIRNGVDGRKICMYNAYGKLIKQFYNLDIACKELRMRPSRIRSHLEGKMLHYKKYVLRYEGDSFDKYPRSKWLQPITLYDLFGNYVSDFETEMDAAIYLKTKSGVIKDTLKRKGTCKGFYVVKYGTDFSLTSINNGIKSNKL